MSKTPEEYFQEVNFSAGGGSGGAFSAAELAFIRKYMGIDAPETLRKLGLDGKAEQLAEEPVPTVPDKESSPLEALISNIDEVRPLAEVPRSIVGAVGLVEPGAAPAARSEVGPMPEPEAVEHEEADLADAMEMEDLAEVSAPVAFEVSAVPEADIVVDVAAASVEAAEAVKAAEEPAPAPAAAPPAVPAPAPPTLEDPTPEAEPEAPKPAPAQEKPRPTLAEIYDGMDIQAALDHFLKHESELQMVAFYIGNQEFVVPTVIVQEVIHYSTPAKLPAAPPFVAGVISLRGKVTPLMHLRDVLEVKTTSRAADDRFIIVCRFQGLQVGLIIERVHSMYRVPQKDIDWGIEAHLGINVDYVSGLLKLGERLVGIVSVDKIVANLLVDEVV
ncbi:MAG: chemotaxis protein CheW [Deltaproteobacteria bacterium]|jgi:purine-binding chemotaxis protein CheW|nr:chemotaxis protein CheW [Deltaproteobacteria bacterium]